MEKRITMRGAKMAMFITWIVGLTLSIPFAVYRNYKVQYQFHPRIFRYLVLNPFDIFWRFRIFIKERHWKNFVEKFCVENMTILPLYWHVILLLLVLFPLIVMTICYSTIFWKVQNIQHFFIIRVYVFIQTDMRKKGF